VVARTLIFPIDCLFCFYDIFAVNLMKTGVFDKRCSRNAACKPIRKYTNKWLFRLLVCPRVESESRICTAGETKHTRPVRAIIGLTAFLILIGGIATVTTLNWSPPASPAAERQVADGAAGEYLAEARRAYTRGDYRTALQGYRRALRASPGLKDAEFMIGMCLHEKGQEDRARAYFGRAARGPHGIAEAAGMLAHSLYEAGQIAKAGQAAERALDLGSGSAPVHAMMADYLLINEHLDAARSHLEVATEKEPDNEIVMAARLKMLLKTGETERAVSLMESVEDPIELPTWRLCRILLLQRQGKADEAYDELQQVLAEYTTSALAQVWNVELLLQAGRKEDALAKVRDLMKSFPLPPEQKLRLGRLLRAHGEGQEALEIALGLTGSRQTGASAHRLAGEIYADEGLLLRARWHADEALDAHPDDPLALALAGRAAYAEDKHLEARRALERAIEQKPDFAHAHFLLGLNDYADDNPRRALPHLAEACELAPHMGRYHYYHGRALAGSGDDKGAAVELKKATELMPDPYRAWTDLGMLADKRGDTEEARSCYSRAVEANPRRAAAAYNNLASGLLDSEQNISFALALAHTAQALSSASSRAATSDTYATALILSGYSHTALRPAREAVRARPDSPHIQLRLGLAESAAGNRENAIAALKRATELAEEPETRKRAENLLKQVIEKLPQTSSTGKDEDQSSLPAR
jgi:tetratricopeptide (TPR) repeat protein